jgi:hypothetical protein
MTYADAYGGGDDRCQRSGYGGLGLHLKHKAQNRDKVKPSASSEQAHQAAGNKTKK